LVFFAIILLGGLFQALFGLLRLGTLIKFAPHPVMAGFQNMAAVLLFLVQLGNVLGYEHNIRFTRVFGAMNEARPLNVLVAALTFVAMWNARRSRQRRLRSWLASAAASLFTMQSSFRVSVICWVRLSARRRRVLRCAPCWSTFPGWA
jgi:MFS superfamily sulfate permease-like transporter